MAVLKQVNITNTNTGLTSTNSLGAEAENIDVYRNSSGNITDAAHKVTSESLNSTLSNIENNKQNKLIFDDNPTANSNNPVKSSGIKNALDGKAASTHNHDASDINSGTLSIARGGTNASTVAGARNNLGLGNTSGPVPVANGGTGTTDGTLNGVKLATSGNQYGYMDGNIFKPFRQPTGNASSAQVLSGYTFSNASSDSISGGMSNNGALNPSSLSAGGSYTIPEGYTSGGTVTAKSLASQTGVDSGKTAAGSNQILSGYQAWVNGTKVTGGIPNRGEYQMASRVGGGTDYISFQKIPEGYYPSSSNTWAPEIRAAKTYFGDAAAGDVISGKTFTSTAGLKVSGTMTNLSESTIYQHSSGNTTPHLAGDEVFFTMRYNKSTRANDQNVIGIRYNSTNGYLKSNTLVSYPATAFGNASDGQVLASNTYTSQNGLKRTGTMVNRDNSYQWPSGFATGSYTYSDGHRVQMQYAKIRDAGYYSTGSKIILQEQPYIANRVVKGYTVIDVAGAWVDSATYTFGENNGAQQDLGETNNYRYVNATKVVDWSRKNISGVAISGETETDSSVRDVRGLAIGTYCIIAVNNSKNVKVISMSSAQNITVLHDGPLYGDGTNGAYGWYKTFRVTNDANTARFTVNVTCKVIKVLKFTI